MDPATCPQVQSAIWGRAGIVIDPGTGNLRFATGNGNDDGKTASGDALIMLDPNATKMVGKLDPDEQRGAKPARSRRGIHLPCSSQGGFHSAGGKDGTIRLQTMDIIKGTEAHPGGELQVVPTRAALSSSPLRPPQKSTTRLNCLPRKAVGAAEAPHHKLTEA